MPCLEKQRWHSVFVGYAWAFGFFHLILLVGVRCFGSGFHSGKPVGGARHSQPGTWGIGLFLPMEHTRVVRAEEEG